MNVSNAIAPSRTTSLSPRDANLVALGRALLDAGYRFTTVTPSTHGAYLRRRHRPAATLRDVFGWNLPFGGLAELPRDILALAERADVFSPTGIGDQRRATVRFSTTAAGQIYVHSAFAEGREDMIFFGPDSYRFVAWLDRCVERAGTVVDIGCGSGVGGLHLASRASRVILTDLNPRALSFAAVNAAIHGIDHVRYCLCDVLAGVAEPVDVIVANPPYMMDPTGPTYRNGGDIGGAALSVRIVEEALDKLGPGGQLVLYTATTFVDGDDRLLAALLPVLGRRPLAFEYVELDPDVFADELDKPGYEDVERIAVVGLSVRIDPEPSRPRLGK